VLRTNLSTHPFYNERAVHLALGFVALLVLAWTAVNVVEIVKLSRQNTELSARIARDRGEVERLTREAARTRQGLDQNELRLVVAAAREANTLIDRRTFSWTSFFNHIEANLPPDVMLTSVRPTVDEDGTRVSMIVLGRRWEDVDEFMEKLEATGVFENVLPKQQTANDQGLMQVVLEAEYVPHSEPGNDAQRVGEAAQ
jgi:Tfp pilus assembly protein PilN